MFIAISLFIVALFVYFKFIKSTNDNIYEAGRILHAQLDALEFLNTPYSHLRTGNEKAIFHYCINRPWKDSIGWFGQMQEFIEESEKEGLDEDSSLYLKGLHNSMVGTAPLGTMVKLMGLPKEIRSLSPIDYAKWSSLHNKRLRENPNALIGDFVSESSKAAAISYTSNIRKLKR